MNQRIPDNYDAWKAHDAAQAEEFYKFGGLCYCPECVELYHMKFAR